MERVMFMDKKQYQVSNHVLITLDEALNSQKQIQKYTVDSISKSEQPIKIS